MPSMLNASSHVRGVPTSLLILHHYLRQEVRISQKIQLYEGTLALLESLSVARIHLDYAVTEEARVSALVGELAKMTRLRGVRFNRGGNYAKVSPPYY